MPNITFLKYPILAIRANGVDGIKLMKYENESDVEVLGIRLGPHKKLFLRQVALLQQKAISSKTHSYTKANGSFGHTGL